MANGTVPNLEAYIKSGFNVLLSGLHGVGKTVSVKSVCDELGLKLKYYSASTLDPYTDLVGVPVPRPGEDGVETLKMVRPRSIDEADVVFFDELNRAEAKTRNAVMELVQFREINGEPLPNLKCVIAAINPPDGEYDVEDLDPALVDRFHVMLEIKPRVSVAYLKKKLGDRHAQALVTWYSSHNKKTRAAYLSPRRVEILGEVWKATRSADALKAALPPDGVFEVSKLVDALREADMSPAEIKAAEDARKAAAKAAADAEKARRATVGSWTTKELRDTANASVIAGALDGAKTDLKLHTYVAEAFRANVGVGKLFGEYSVIMRSLNEAAVNSVIGAWPKVKQSQARQALASHLTQNHKKSSKAEVSRLYGPLGRSLASTQASGNVVEAHIKRYGLK